MIYLKQSTASQEIPLGHFVDDADGKTAETSLTIANTDIKVWKSGATTLANKNSGGATHISGGIYYAVLDATDTDTLGPLVIFVAVSGALAVRLECTVMTSARYDALFGSGALDVNVTAMAADVVTASAIASDAIGALELAAGAASEIATAVRSELTTELGRIDAAVSTRATPAQVNTEVDTALADYDGPTHAELTSAIAAGDDAVLSAVAALNNLSSAQAQTAAAAALTAYDPPTHAELTSGLAAADDAVLTAIDALPTAVENADALLARNIGGGSSTGRTVTQALRALRNKTALSGSTVTVYREDDTTSDWTATVTTSDRSPIASVDPA